MIGSQQAEESLKKAQQDLRVSVSQTQPLIQEVYHKMKVLADSFALVDAIIFPKNLKNQYFDYLDGISEMAKETKRQIELKGK